LTGRSFSFNNACTIKKLHPCFSQRKTSISSEDHQAVAVEGVSPFWRRYFAIILRYRHLAFVLSIVFLLIVGSGIKGLEVDFNVESLFPRDDGKLLSFRDYIAKFGRDDDLLLLLCETDRLEKETFVRSLDALSRDLRGLGFFSDVFSFLDAPHAWLGDDIELGIGPLRDWILPQGRFHPDRMISLIASLTPDDSVLNNFLSPASQTGILLLRLSTRYADNQGRLEATARLRDWLGKQNFPEIKEITLSGMPAARADGMRMIQRDQKRLLPLSLVISMFMLFCFFGRLRDVALVISHILVTLLATMGCMGHLGLKFSILSSMIPVILVTTGSSYGIQILARLRSLQIQQKTVYLEDLFASMMGPIFLANITTVVGFISLFETNMQLINEFAAITAAGVFIAFVLTITIFPLMVALFPGSVLPEIPLRKSRFLPRLLLRFGHFVIRRPRQIFGGLFVFGVGAVYCSSFVQVRAFVFDDFWPDSLMMRHIRKAEQICNGVLPMSVMITSTRNEAVLRLHFIQKAAKVATFLRRQPEVGKVDSPSDALGRMFRLLTDNATRPGNHFEPPSGSFGSRA